jgi:signal transduction histidine kinase
MKLSLRAQVSVVVASVIMLALLYTKSTIILGYRLVDHSTQVVEFWLVVAFLPFFFFACIEFVRKARYKFQSIDATFNAINYSNILVEFDTEGKVLSANDKFKKLLGEVKNHRDLDNSPIKEWREFWTHLKIGYFKQGEYDYNGVWLYGNFNPIKDPYGEVYKILLIATEVTEKKRIEAEVAKKNSYLEHAAKILRHDMHSGINTYIPRGLSSLKRRLTQEQIKELKIDAPLRMIEEGLIHTQKVYNGVKEFTNLVKQDAHLELTLHNLKDILHDYLSSTSYEKQVIIEELPEIEVNESLFCTAVDNLIRNGLKYNDSSTKLVRIFAEGDYLIIQDNGRGMSQDDLIQWSKPYKRKEGQKESGTGLGLNICTAIMEEHKFTVVAEKLSEPEAGTKLKIKIK